MEQLTVMKNRAKSSSLLNCTIGICAYNEQSNIGLLLHNLINDQYLGREMQILVVCSGCTDHTPDIVRQFCQRDRRIELILQQERMGKSSAINEILKRASNQLIFFVSADVLPSSGSLKSLSEEFSDTQVGAACGSPNPINRKTSFSGYLANLMWRMHNETLKMLCNLKIDTHASGELMAIRRGLIDEIPDGVINDDAYMALEIGKKCRVKYCEAAKVYMKAPSNVVDFVRQRRRVMFGHHSVRRATGLYPRTLGAMPYYDIKKLAKVIRDEIKSHSSDLPKLGLAVTLEIVANGLAWVDVILKRRHTSWSVVTSTKNLSCVTPRFNADPLPYPNCVNEMSIPVKS